MFNLEIDLKNIIKVNRQGTYMYCHRCHKYWTLDQIAIEWLEDFIFENAIFNDPEDAYSGLEFEPGMVFLDICPHCIGTNDRLHFSPINYQTFRDNERFSVSFVCRGCNQVRQLDQSVLAFVMPVEVFDTVVGERPTEQLARKILQLDKKISILGFDRPELVETFLQEESIHLYMYATSCPLCPDFAEEILRLAVFRVTD